MAVRPVLVRCGDRPCTYRQLFDAVDDVLYVRDLAGVILDINAAGVRFFGRPKETIVGRTLHAAPADDRALSLMETNLSLLESGRDRSCVTLRNARGEEVDMEVTTTLARDPSGQPVGAFGVMREVRPIRRSRRPEGSRVGVPGAETTPFPLVSISFVEPSGSRPAVDHDTPVSDWVPPALDDPPKG